MHTIFDQRDVDGMGCAVYAELTTRLTAGRSLDFDEAFHLCDRLLRGEFASQQAAQILVALAEKGETPEELHGFVSCLLSHSERVPFGDPTFDTCGTGGSGLVRFNVSTAVAFILAAAGVVVAKHGNRGSRTPNGSFDLLEALGIPVELTPVAVAGCIEETGLAFLYARTFHPALKRMAEPRALAAQRTIFNLAGPLSNPAPVRAQVVGTPSRKDAHLVAQCLHRMGRSGVALVGHSGLDDIDLSGPALLVGAGAVPVTSDFDPASLEVPRTPIGDVPGGDAPINAELFRLLFDDRAPLQLRQLVCLSASIALVVARKVESHTDGFRLAGELLASGKAKAKYRDYRDAAKTYAGI